jgi:hypothetical protein
LRTRKSARASRSRRRRAHRPGPDAVQGVRRDRGLQFDGYLIVNTARTLSDIHPDAIVARLPAGHLIAAPATELAMKFVGRPAPNTALLGAFAAAVGTFSLDSVLEAIRRAPMPIEQAARPPQPYDMGVLYGCVAKTG